MEASPIRSEEGVGGGGRKGRVSGRGRYRTFVFILHVCFLVVLSIDLLGEFLVVCACVPLCVCVCVCAGSNLPCMMKTTIGIELSITLFDLIWKIAVRFFVRCCY